jgi:hypothetical protein
LTFFTNSNPKNPPFVKKLILNLLVVSSVCAIFSLSSCSATYYDVYFSQGIDSTQKFRLVIDGENWGFLPYRTSLVECKDTAKLGHAKLLEGVYKIQIRSLSDELMISQNLTVAERGVSVSGTKLAGEVKATSQCAMTHFFITK